MQRKNKQRGIHLMRGSNRLAGILLLLFSGCSNENGAVSEIIIIGNRNVQHDTIISYLPIRLGDDTSIKLLNDARDNLRGTELFSSVDIERAGHKLFVRVQERPLLSGVTFSGNEQLSGQELTDALSIGPNSSFDEDLVEFYIEVIKKAYNLSQHKVPDVASSVEVDDEYTVRLKFQITEDKSAKLDGNRNVVSNQNENEGSNLPAASSLRISGNYYGYRWLASKELNEYYLGESYRQGSCDSEQKQLASALKSWREIGGTRDAKYRKSAQWLVDCYFEGAEYTLAIGLLKELLDVEGASVGPGHRGSLATRYRLGTAYYHQESYGQAEDIFLGIIQDGKMTAPANDLAVRLAMLTLAHLYLNQDRIPEGRALAQRQSEVKWKGTPSADALVLELRIKAQIHQIDGKTQLAESVLIDAYELSKNKLGVEDELTLAAMNDLSVFYSSRGNNRKAQSYREMELAAVRRRYGEDDPQVVARMINEATAQFRRGRELEAGALLKAATEVSRTKFGASMGTIIAGLEYAAHLTRINDLPAAVHQLTEVKSELGFWIDHEISTSGDTARLVGVESLRQRFYNYLISMAISWPDDSALQYLVVESALRLKGLVAGQEAELAQLVRDSSNPVVQQIARQVTLSREHLTTTMQGSTSSEDRLTALANVREADLSLRSASPEFERISSNLEAGAMELIARIPERHVVVDFIRFRSTTRGRRSPDYRFAAVVVDWKGRIAVYDCGSVAETEKLVSKIVEGGDETRGAAQLLYDRLVRPLELAVDATTIYISPDSFLHVLPFHRLEGDSGSVLIEQFDVRLIQTTRDLLSIVDRPSTAGLVAFGGIDFGVAGSLKVGADEGLGPDAGSRVAFPQGFQTLPDSVREIDKVADWYSKARPGEPISIWSGKDASERQLKDTIKSPRVLHLATHGFYIPSSGMSGSPMLNAGITLAGANDVLAGRARDGILYAIEAQELYLEGTELVVLSACETARGIAMGDGVYGLVRALRTAGSRYVLATIRPVQDSSSMQFMERFYYTMLSQGLDGGGPAVAMRDTQLWFIRNKPKFDWAAYMLIGV